MSSTDAVAVAEAMAGLSVSEMFSEDNVGRAISDLKKGTVPGRDGLDTAFYARDRVKKAVVPSLCALFKRIEATKDMTAAMKEAIITVLYKGRGKDRNACKSYRPVSVTPTEYRIMMKAVQLKMRKAVEAVVGQTQMAYLGDGRYPHDNTLLLAEGARRMEEEGRGGVAIQVDNTAAFDRVRHDFMHEVLEALGFPPEFRDLMHTIYKGLQYRMKVNGEIGESRRAKNGVRQGCPASPLAFLLVQEALLICIRADEELEGVRVSRHPQRGEARERCLADDTVVYVSKVEHVGRLLRVIGQYEAASGQELNPTKSVGVVFGGEKQKPLPADTGLKWIRYGEEPLEAGLGISVGTEEQIVGQWAELMGGVREECATRMRQLRKDLSPTARVNVVQGAYASRLLYQARIQVPRTADEEIRKTQAVFDRAVFGEPGDAYYYINRATAYQHPRDGGLGHVHLESKLRAEWGSLAMALGERSEAWKDVWLEEMAGVYGPLADAHMVYTSCAFALFARSGRGSEVQRRALEAVGSLPAPVGRVRQQQQRKGQWQAAGPEMDASEGRWKVMEIADQRVFFNVWFQGRTRLSGRSTAAVETEAVEWAQAGVITLRDLMGGNMEMLSEQAFRLRYPGLRGETYREVLRDMPEAWQERLSEGDEQESEAPSDGEGAKRVVREAAVGYPETIGEPRSPRDVRRLGTGGIYDRLIAARWELPTTFRPAGDGTRIWKQKRLEESRKGCDIRRVYESTRHPAVPRHMSDLAYKVATGTDFVGARFFKQSNPRHWCPRCGAADSCLHKFLKCEEVTKLWELIAGAWQRMCGEKLDWTDEWVALWGARWRKREEATAEGKAVVLQAAARAGMAKKRGEEVDVEGAIEKAKRKAKGLLAGRGRGWTEVFQVIHKAALKVIDTESHRKAPRRAREMYQAVHRVVEQMVRDRWQSAGGGAAFEVTWVRTGLVQVRGRGRVMTGRMWAKDMRPVKVVRAREEAAVPEGLLELYTDGSGGKAGGPNAYAGWGFVAVQADREIDARCGVVSTDEGSESWEGAERGTNNTAEITAVMKALGWAAHRGEKAVCVRYDSEYAASMTRGRWRPKRNKRLVEAAQQALKHTEAAGVQVWWKHVKGHSGHKWNDRADELADEGIEDAMMDAIEEEGGLPGRLCAGAGDARGAPKVARARAGHGVRWVTYNPTETARVMRSRTDFGALNLPVPKQPISGVEIRRAGAECLREMAREERECVAGLQEAAVARERVRCAMRRLSGAAAQREDMRARARPARPVHELDCDIDVAALRVYLEEHGGERIGSGTQTAVQAVEALMRQATRVSEDVARVRLKYHYSDIGRSLWEAGHVTGSREMVKGVDPFRWPKGLRGAALGSMGAEYDDKSCYPMAWRAMRGSAGPMADAWAMHKEEILGLYGAHLWPDVGAAEQRERMKSAMSALDNDGGLSSWKKKYPSNKSLAGVRKTLSDGTVFNVSAYKKEQEDSTQKAMLDSRRALQYLQRLGAVAGKTAPTERALRTKLKSYMLQEAEAASREAKLRWAAEEGVRVISLQHDGVVAMVQGEERVQAAAEAMACAATAACGYGVKVIPKEAVVLVS